MKKPLPERLAYQQSHLEARLEQVKAVRAAVEKLYAKLSDEQRRAADDIVLPMMGMDGLAVESHRTQSDASTKGSPLPEGGGSGLSIATDQGG